MPDPKYAAGFRFVVNTPETNKAVAKHARKAVRSHAAKARPRRRQGVQLKSWISPERELVSLDSAPDMDLAYVSVPPRAGSEFSAQQLPPGIEPYMIQDLIKLVAMNKLGVYRYEVCLNVHPVDRGWFPYMLSDLCCLHSMMFCVRAFVDTKSLGGRESRMAAFHYAQTLRLLQAQLNASVDGSSISDATIVVVVTLAQVAELSEDCSTAMNHVEGLIKMVAMRGGLRALTAHNNMQVKVCRADLRFALRYGKRPRLFREDISWDCFIANRGMIRCSHEPHATNMHPFVKTLDWRLQNAWNDLHAFSCISNLAYQTTRKLSPETYNEMMISILYRLAHLSFDDLLEEAVRTGLLAYASTLFMQRHYMQKPHEYLLNTYAAALQKLRQSPDVNFPSPVALWFTLVYLVLACQDTVTEDWPGVWIDEAVACLRVDSWSQAHDMLKAIMWVDFVHTPTGLKAFDASVSRAQERCAGRAVRGSPEAPALESS